ncbi:MAG: hypothetical protein E6767_08035 [Dysgonomonas sp.]|nr:hypothetical protein [Dysgonomonas sp.]
MKDEMLEKQILLKIKALTLFYIFALVFWGATAFPIETEIRIACQILGISLDEAPETYSGLTQWIAVVANGVVHTNLEYSFLAYGTDWLAFSHLVIAVAFIGLYIKPIRNKWIIYFGMIACIGVLPVAIICGPIRGIPFYWTLIDCSFCFLGLVPLYLLHIYVKRLEVLVGYIPQKY